MTENEADYRDRLARSVLQALFDEAKVEVDGGAHAVFNVEIIVDALTLVMAAMTERAPGIQTQKDIRNLSEWVARDLRQKFKQLRKVYETTGQRAFDAQIIQPH